MCICASRFSLSSSVPLVLDTRPGGQSKQRKQLSARSALKIMQAEQRRNIINRQECVSKSNYVQHDVSARGTPTTHMCKTGLLRGHLADSEGSGDYGPQMLHEASSPAAPPQGTWGCQEWAEHLHTHYADPATTAMQLKCAAFTSAASNPLYQQEPVPSIHNAGVGYRDSLLLMLT